MNRRRGRNRRQKQPGAQRKATIPWWIVVLLVLVAVAVAVGRTLR